MEGQPSLFDVHTMKKNQVINLIISLDFVEAKREIQSHNKTYNYSIFETEIIICDYFIDNANISGPESMHRAWIQFERLKSDLSLKINYFDHIKTNYFKKLCLLLDDQPSDLLVINDTPSGLLYMYADNPKKARQKLEQAIVKSPNPSALYSYLSHVHFLCKEIKESRICLREAFECDPYEVHLDLITDLEVQDLIGDVDGLGKTVTWIVSYGCVRKIFPAKVIRLIEDMRVYVDGFIVLEKEYMKDKNMEAGAKLFYKCLVLSDNNKNLQHITAVELTKLRKYMKEINPALFKQYLASIEETK